MALPAPVIETHTSLLLGEKNSAFSFQPAATNSPTAWSATGLPAGLSINASTGQITGTPTEAGIFGVVLKASNFDVRAVTVVNATDLFTSNGNSLSDLDIVTFATDDTLPTPLTTIDEYEIRDKAGDDFKVSTVPGGPALDITDDGTGNHTISLEQSGELLVLIPIIDSTSVIDPDKITVELDVDIVTGKVTLLGGESAVFGPPGTELRDDGLLKPVLFAKLGDVFPVAIGFTRNGILQDLALTEVTFGAKEFDPENLFSLQQFGTGFVKIGTGNTTRYVVDFAVERSVWEAVLSNFEADIGTYLDSLAEVEYVLPKNVVIFDVTKTATVTDFTGGDVQNDTLSFITLAQIQSPVQYLLDLDVDFSGDYIDPTNQDVAHVAIQFTAEYNGLTSQFDITNFSTVFLEGVDRTPTHWRSKLTALTMVGTATGVDVGSKLEATGITPVQTIVMHFHENSAEYQIVGGVINKEIGASDGYFADNILQDDVNSWNINDGDTPNDIKTTLNALPAPFANEVANVIFDETEQNIIVELNGANDLAVIGETGQGSLWTRKLTGGDEHNGLITARVYADTQSNNYRKTSESFIARIETDKVEGSGV